MSNIQITKQTISAKPRKLNAAWTVEQTQDSVSFSKTTPRGNRPSNFMGYS